jgi:hypothetical protein
MTNRALWLAIPLFALGLAACSTADDHFHVACDAHGLESGTPAYTNA